MAVVEISDDDGVGIVTLNDPERRNVMTAEVVDGIVAAFDRLEADEAIGAIVVTGAPPAFCAGADLGHLGRGGRDDKGGDVRSIYEGFLRVQRSPLPTVAAVNGAAVGAGMNLALACDVRIAGKRAKFIDRFLELGLHPGGGHTWMLQRIVGPQVAAAMVLFGEVLDGDAAAAAGLALRCVEDDALLDEAKAFAAKATSAPRPLSIRTKATLQTMPMVSSGDEAVDVEYDAQSWSFTQPFFAERLKAMQAKVNSPKP